MQRYEYKVIPAPVKGEKARGVKGTPGRFAYGLTRIMNELARDGWEYLRADTLPCEERTGLTGKTVTYQNMLVFRRALAGALPIFDQATVPGVTANGLLAADAAPAVPGGAVPLSDGQKTDGRARTDETTAKPGRSDAGDHSGAFADRPPLSARAPEGKAPRITAFDRLADSGGRESPAPEGTVSKG